MGCLGCGKLNSFSVLLEWSDHDKSFIRSLSFRPDGRQLAIAGQGGSRVSSLNVDPDSSGAAGLGRCRPTRTGYPFRKVIEVLTYHVL